MVCRRHRRMSPGISLNVFVGVPQLLRQLPDGPCLVIDADQQRLDQFRLQHPVERHGFAVELIQGVVAPENNEGLTWYRFSDARFNGPWPLSTWVGLAPNLREIDHCSVRPRPLTSFLDDSGLQVAQTARIKLWLRQGNPTHILESAGSTLRRLDSILLRYPALPDVEQIALEKAFSQPGFVLSDLDDNVWIRPSIRFSEIQPSALVNLLKLVFDRDSYLKLYPHLVGYSDDAVLEHWLNQSYAVDVSSDMRKIWLSRLLQVPEIDPPEIVNALDLLFDHHSYRQLKPELADCSDQELMADWLKQPDWRELWVKMNGIRQAMPRQIDQIGDDDLVIQALSSLFPYSFYREQRPDLAQLSDPELVRHYCRVGRDEGVSLTDGVLMPHLMEALIKVFPYTMYRQQCPDLADLDDRSLIEHYCRSGMHQTVDLSEQSVVKGANAFPASEQEQLRVRVKELEQLLVASSAQISELQQALAESVSRRLDA